MARHVERKKGHYRGGGAPKGNQNAKGNRGGTGRPATYDPVRFPRLARALAADGKLDIDLAQAFQVSPWCICAWKRKYPEFRAACEVTDEEKLEAVKRSLFHRATGYSHSATRIVAVAAGGGTSEIVRVPYVEHYPPDTAAIRYYLNNRVPGERRERANTRSGVGEVVVRVLGGLPKDESDGSGSDGRNG